MYSEKLPKIYKHKKQSSGDVLSKDVLKNFSKFTEKHLLWSLFFNKVANWKPENCQRQRLQMFCKKGGLKNFANFASVLLIKLQF